jgi:hypothetical protein
MVAARWIKGGFLGATVVVVLGLALGVPVASAQAPAPWWHLASGARPTYLAPGGEGTIVATVLNVGDASASGEVRIVDRLPAGLRAVSVEAGAVKSSEARLSPISCPRSAGAEVECLATGAGSPFGSAVPPFAVIEVRVGVVVEPGAKTGEQNEVSVSGGDARPASIARPLTISAQPVPFGVEGYELTPESAGGGVDTQAGSHPFQTVLSVSLNQTAESQTGFGLISAAPVALARDLSFKLPPGLIGNPAPFTRCTDVQFLAAVNECPASSIVGVAVATADDAAHDGIVSFTQPLYNLEPNMGEPARFGFEPIGPETPVYIDTAVRSGSDYGITTRISQLTQAAGLLSSVISFWGVPGESSHDATRGVNCLAGVEAQGPCEPLDESDPPPFFTLPSSCTGQPLLSEVELDSWDDPGSFLDVHTGEGANAPLPTLDGCAKLPFEPSVDVSTDATQASSPAGFDVDVHVPQGADLDAEALAPAEPKDITIALPAGVSVDPSGTDGLEACSEGQFGLALGCPAATEIGTVAISSPLLPAGEGLKGAVYLANQNENPFGSLLALYLVAEDPISGVLVKLAGRLALSEAGQITATFEDTPQLPLEDLELHFFGGELAPLASPARCGTYTTNATFVPWSAEPSDAAALTVASASTFDITAGPKTAAQPDGSSCPGAALPFEPSLSAGTTNIQAGGFSPLSITISREDGEQALRSVRLQLPAGLEGLLSAVPLCGEEQANQGTCPAASQIGETTISAGLGSEPVSITGGKVYLTGHTLLEGPNQSVAPFGLSIVDPVKAGPLDLERDTAGGAGTNNDPACDCVVVRAKLEVDPTTAALTIATNSSGSYAIPQIIDGIPLEIKNLNITIDGPGGHGFIFDPSNCNPLAITGTITGGEGASAPVSTPFQVTNCASLKFSPKLTASTAGKTSIAKGAALKVKLTEAGGEANLKSLKIDLPKQLPSRLTTLQRACKKAQFAANPAGCPASSAVGQAKVLTPVLPVSLEGPAYFVSNGGESLPDLEIVLQGDGVKLDLVGNTFIENKKNTTSATFRTLPDVPISTFELTLPEGKYSAFGTDKNLCKSKLAMPTALVGQNGAALHTSTKVAVTGCPKSHKAKKARKAKKAAKGKKRRT